MKLKLKRQLTAILPVSKQREGKCYACGACCKLAFKCPFLKESPSGKNMCRIYKFRFLSCKKYPRHVSEFETAKGCGYKFNLVKKDKHSVLRTLLEFLSL